ncbi:hypothetical protein Tco_1503378 [Tanacetum coccineum]
MITAAAGCNETPAVDHPPPLRQHCGDQATDARQRKWRNIGAAQLSRTHEWLECEKVQGGLLSVEQPPCPLCLLKSPSLNDIVANYLDELQISSRDRSHTLHDFEFHRYGFILCQHDSTQILIIDQPSSSSQPKKKQPSKKAQRQEAEVPQDETEHEESVPTPSNDPQPSEEDLEVRKEENVRPTGLKRLRKVGMSRRVESSEDQESLGASEDASKQERSIADMDADNDVTLVDETQERQDDDLMFDTGVLDDDEMDVEAKVDGKDEAITTVSVDDSTAGEIKAAKPKVVTTAATTTTTIIPKARGVVVQEPSEFKVPQETQPSSSKDKGKAMIEADRLMAERLQSKEREELTDEEKAKLFMELMEKRRKHFAALRAQEKRNRPPTKAQNRT